MGDRDFAHWSEFQPTPSARRVTIYWTICIYNGRFQPTPSARRVTGRNILTVVIGYISTHTLRKEGDITVA